MALSLTQLIDAVAATQAKQPKGKVTELATDTQKHVAFNRLFRDKVAKTSGGITHKRTLMLNHSDAARFVGPFETDVVNVKDVLGTVSIDLRRCTTNYSFDVTEEAVNSGPEQIVDIVKIRRWDAFIALAAKIEANFWSMGPTSSSDLLTPFGIKYWMTPPSSGDTGSFGGGAPSGHTAGAGGLLHDRWKNWTADYDAVTRADLITKMREGFAMTDFESPVLNMGLPDNQRGPDKCEYFMNYKTFAQFVQAAEDQNENLGWDLNANDGKIRFHGCGMTWIPGLAADTANPVLGVNWSVLYPVILANFNVRESKPEKAPLQHTVVVSHTDIVYNTMCENRRSLQYDAQV